MEAVVRILRAGRDQGVAPCGALVDNLDAVGGGAFLHKMLGQIIDSVAAGSLTAHTVVVVALEEPPSAYEYLSRGSIFNKSTIIDGFSDPFGWAHAQKASVPLSTQQFMFAEGVDGLSRRLLTFASNAAGAAVDGNSSSICIVFDSLTPLIDNFSAQQVAQLLATLRRDPFVACLAFRLHSDLHKSLDIAAVLRGVSCTAHLEPASGISLSGISLSRSISTAVTAQSEYSTDPLGRVIVRSRRRSGCVRIETHNYWISKQEGLKCVPHSKGAPGQRTTPLSHSTVGGGGGGGSAAAVATKTSEAVSALPAQLAGGMRLSVSEEEAAARAAVPLPYEHQGQGSLYSTSDYRDYLPKAAGGRGGTAGKLGHILYVRDSDSDEPDSDEDPDDDLDI